MRQNAVETIDFPTSLPVPKNMMALAISYFLFFIMVPGFPAYSGIQRFRVALFLTP